MPQWSGERRKWRVWITPLRLNYQAFGVFVGSAPIACGNTPRIAPGYRLRDTPRIAPGYRLRDTPGESMLAIVTIFCYA